MYETYFEQLQTEMKLRNLKASTSQSYQEHIQRFLTSIAKEPTELTPEDVRSFLLAKKAAGTAASTINLYRCALYFFVRRVLRQRWDWEMIPPMKTDRTLPTLLSQDEIERLLAATKNLKHRAMLTTMYSAGLRVSEVCHLHYQDVSRRSMQIHVRKSKSRFDHYTILSQRNLDVLSDYWQHYGRPREILFPSSHTGSYLSRNGLLEVVKKSAKRAGIQKKVGCHTLRHAFACHMFEDKVERIYIQSFLGHLHPQSTDVYLHMTNKALLGIKSPFDRFGGGKDE